jgi:hypothetical protein
LAVTDRFPFTDRVAVCFSPAFKSSWTTQSSSHQGCGCSGGSAVHRGSFAFKIWFGSLNKVTAESFEKSHDSKLWEMVETFYTLQLSGWKKPYFKIERS